MKQLSIKYHYVILICLLLEASTKIIKSNFAMNNLMQTTTHYFQLSKFYTSGLGGNVSVIIQLHRNYQNPQKFVYIDLISDDKLEQYKKSQCPDGQSQLILHRFTTTFDLRKYQQKLQYSINKTQQSAQQHPLQYYLMLSLCQPLDLISQMLINDSDKLKFQITWFNGQSPIARDQQVIEVYWIVLVILIIAWIKSSTVNILHRFQIFWVVYMIYFSFATIQQIFRIKMSYDFVYNMEEQNNIWLVLSIFCKMFGNLFLLTSFGFLTNETQQQRQIIICNQHKQQVYRKFRDIVLIVSFIVSLLWLITIMVAQVNHFQYHPTHQYTNYIYLMRAFLLIYFMLNMLQKIRKSVNKDKKQLKNIMTYGFLYIVIDEPLRLIIQYCLHSVDHHKYQTLIIKSCQVILLSLIIHQMQQKVQKLKQIQNLDKDSDDENQSNDQSNNI